MAHISINYRRWGALFLPVLETWDTTNPSQPMVTPRRRTSNRKWPPVSRAAAGTIAGHGQRPAHSSRLIPSSRDRHHALNPPACAIVSTLGPDFLARKSGPSASRRPVVPPPPPHRSTMWDFFKIKSTKSEVYIEKTAKNRAVMWNFCQKGTKTASKASPASLSQPTKKSAN